jgi:hypothetical protein
MLNIKVEKKNLGEDFLNKTFGSNIISYIKKLFLNEKISVIDDSKSLELITANNSEVTGEGCTVELTFKKIITINNSDKQSIDRFISEVKNFCDQAVKINDYVYVPLNMRENKNVNITTSFTGNSK